MRQNDPLRALSDEEREALGRLSRSGREAAAVVARAKALLAVADGASYSAAARLAGRRSGDAVCQLGARLNREGVEAPAPEHGGGPPARYTSAEPERIPTETRRQPDPRRGG